MLRYQSKCRSDFVEDGSRRDAGLTPARGAGQRLRRALAEGFAIVPREVSEIAEAADKGDGCDGSLKIRRGEHFAGMPEPDHPCKSHRRIAAAPLKVPEDRAGADAGRLDEFFDRYRLVPMGLDEFLRQAHMRWQRILRLPLQELAEVMTVGAEERHQNGLLEFAEHQRRQRLGGRVELFGEKKNQPPELLKAGSVSVDGGLEFKLAARPRAEQVGELAFERAWIDPQVEPLMADVGVEDNFLARRDDAGLFPIQCKRAVSDRRTAVAAQGREQAKPPGLRIADRDTAAAIAVNQADILKLNEIAPRPKLRRLLHFGFAGAKTREQHVAELFRIRCTKDRKSLERIGQLLGRHGSVCSHS